MIYVHFIGYNNKSDKLLIHAGIIKNFTIISNSLVLELKRSQVDPKAKKGDKLSGFEWTWTKNINDITNYHEVITFLKTLNLGAAHAKIIDNITKEDNQASLF